MSIELRPFSENTCQPEATCHRFAQSESLPPSGDGRAYQFGLAKNFRAGGHEEYPSQFYNAQALEAGRTKLSALVN